MATMCTNEPSDNAPEGNLYEVMDAALHHIGYVGIDDFELVLKKYVGEEILGIVAKDDLPEEGLDGYIVWGFELSRNNKKLVVDFLVAADGFVSHVAVVRNTYFQGQRYNEFFDFITSVTHVAEMPESLQMMAETVG